MKQTKYTSHEQLPMMMTVRDLADVMGLSLAGCYDLVRSEGFPHLRIGSRILIPKEKFLVWLDQKSSEGAEILG